MPELPEVETVRAGLATYLPGRTIAAVDVRNPRVVRRHLSGSTDFVARLRGRRVEAVSRRGKYLWCVLDDGAALVAHLGMSGQLLLPGADLRSDHVRLVMRFDGAERALHFVDQRTFGGMMLSELSFAPDGRVVPAVIAHIAPDPLEPAFDRRACSRRMRARRTGVKRALLDQTLLSGVGNIYADEALWRARTHYARLTATMTSTQVGAVVDAVHAVLTEAVAAGGTSFDALYVNVNGESGWFARDLNAYGRAGQPCPRCGSLVRRDHFMNRSSYTCPRCQRRPRASAFAP